MPLGRPGHRAQRPCEIFVIIQVVRVCAFPRSAEGKVRPRPASARRPPDTRQVVDVRASRAGRPSLASRPAFDRSTDQRCQHY
jgi:hypothetical protein